MPVKRTKYIDVSQVVKDSAGPAVLAAATAGAGQAKSLAPVDTGRLRSSISAKQKNDKQAIYGSNVDYAIYQEFGTSKQPPQPFLRPSADWLKRQGSKVYAAVLRRALKRG